MKTTQTTQKAKNQKFNRSLIMRRAWKIFKAQYKKDENYTFSEALKQSWSIAKSKKHDLSFNKIYTDNYNKILSYVRMKTNNSIESEEITNDVFTKVFENLDTYDPNVSKITTWIYTFAKNLITDVYRKNAKNEKPIHIDNYVNEEGKEIIQIESNINESNIEGGEITEAVKNAINSLNPKEQKIANLYFIKQMQYKEVAENLIIPVGSVKGTINRIRAKLQETLQNEYLSL